MQRVATNCFLQCCKLCWQLLRAALSYVWMVISVPYLTVAEMKALFIVQNDFYLLFEWREKYHYFSPLKIVQRRSTRVLQCISPFFHIWWTRLEYQMDNWTFFWPICITIIICPCIEMDRGDVIETFLWITRGEQPEKRYYNHKCQFSHPFFMHTDIFLDYFIFHSLLYEKTQTRPSRH